ncbi:MAG: SelT/SelW/SelH family protein [Planctomycetaceae bacterium]|nr:SelT/SelW/SelH family protein [Planctomycetaceae bacterium]
MAEKLLSTHKQKISSLTLEPSSGGCFELTLGDELIYSKLETGEFPNEDQLVEDVGSRL